MIVAGKDKPHLHDIVGAATQWLASGWFHRIFFEANTINITGIDTYLKGISDYYMVGREDEFLEVEAIRWRPPSPDAGQPVHNGAQPHSAFVVGVAPPRRQFWQQSSTTSPS
eukprot:scaffold3544_cov373-Prasinococcus_capsulatus_cf.AAC.8